MSLIIEFFKRHFFSRSFRAQPGSFINQRYLMICAFFVLAFSLLFLRAVSIHLFPPKEQSLSRIAKQQYVQKLTLSPYRGSIFDHRREPLAISLRLPSFFVNPRVFSPNPSQSKALAKLLDMPLKQINEVQTKKSYFAWLKRKAPQECLKKIEDLKIKGLDSVMEPSRYYPAGQIAANLVGYVGVDDHGLGGLEQQFEKTLSGAPVEVSLAKDAHGKLIFSQSEGAEPEKAGDDIYLTIDRALQEITEEELRNGIEIAKAKGGFVIVVDPHTGRILALANFPVFDPNRISSLKIENTKNQALTNIFEPGSVLKPLLVSVGIDRGLITEKQNFDCEGGVFKVGNRTIHDAHPPKKQYLNTEEIIMHSSNVCTYKIAKLIGAEGVYSGLTRFGIGQRQSITSFPGEETGYLANWKSWKPIRFANIAFGQGLSVSGMELVQAYAVIANGGNLIRPYLLDRVESSEGKIRYVNSTQQLRRVIKPDTAKRVRNILYKTVEEAVSAAKLDFHTAAGKTGTTQKIDPHTKAYSHSKHLSSFIGIAPAHDPHLLIYVQVDEPNQKQSYGSIWAAPVFKKIAQRSLSYLNVAPDKALANNTPASSGDGALKSHVNR